MADHLQFRLGHFLLTINSACYLVEVRECLHEDMEKQQNSEIPSWIFDSKHAIWLTDENKPIVERAKHGETIKQQFLQQRPAI